MKNYKLFASLAIALVVLSTGCKEDANLSPQTVDLGMSARFGIFAGVGVYNTGLSEIHDLDIGISPGTRASITGFPPGIVVNGAIYASDDLPSVAASTILSQALLDLGNAYHSAEDAILPAPVSVSGDLGGKTLAPGIYKSTSNLSIQTSDLTLDAQGNANAVWIFQIADRFTSADGTGGNVLLTGGAQAKNIFWQTGISAIVGAGTSFKGNILAINSITIKEGAQVEGRLFSINGAVVTSANQIKKP